MITASRGPATPDLAVVDSAKAAPLATEGDPDVVEGMGVGLEIAALWRDPTGDRSQVLGGELEGSHGAEAEAAHAAEVEARVPTGTPARAAPTP